MSNELYHFGIKGQKWGVRRYQNEDGSYTQAGLDRYAKKIARNEQHNIHLEAKAAKYDKKSEKYKYKAEKYHNKVDLGGSNRLGVKAQKLAYKASKLRKKGLNVADEYEKLKIDRKVAKLEYRGKKCLEKSKNWAATTPYSEHAMDLLNRSTHYAKKAAKSRYKIAKNNSKNAAYAKRSQSLRDDN